jgi:2-dehydro-3-deoxygluconokinase
MDPQRIVCFGEMLLRLNCPGRQRFSEAATFEMLYGGSEANVAILLSRLGIEVDYVTRFPVNDLGDAALESLSRQGVGVTHVLRGGERMGLYFSETGNAVRATRIIYDRTHSGFSSIVPGMIPWHSILQGAGWFHWSGISPAISETSVQVCAEALHQALEAGLRISADFNHRSTLWNYGNHPSRIMPDLLAQCEVITCDLDSAAMYFGINVRATEGIRDAAGQCLEELQKKLPRANTIAMSLRQGSSDKGLSYAGMLLKNGKLYFQEPYQISDPVGRIGSGDAFTGGLLYGVMTGTADAEIVALATACGALKHSIVSDMPLFSLEEVRTIMREGSAGGRIIR